MRSAMLTILFLGLMASPAWAIKGGGPKEAKLKTINNVDSAVDVTVNFNSPVTLEPGQSLTTRIDGFAGSAFATVTANLTGDPSASVTASASVQTGKTATATITGPPLAITFSGKGLAASLLSRESGVVLASGGGLMCLLCLSFLLGRQPRRSLLRRDGT